MVWLVRVGFWLSILFPLYIMPFWRWWDSWWGRNLISFDFSIALTLFPSWLNVTFHVNIVHHATWGWVSVVGLYLVSLNIIWRTAIIVHAQMTRYKSEGINESDNTNTRNSDPV